MAVFRMERTTGYTVMSNHHLRNPGGGKTTFALSLAAACTTGERCRVWSRCRRFK